MIVVVPFTFGSTFVANARAQFEDLPQQLFIRTCPAHCEFAGSLADVRAVEASPDALAHVHLLGRAGVGTCKAHPSAVHEVMRGIPQRLVHMTPDVRMKCNHFSNGHGILLAQACQRSA
jgi:hypothetical protein